MVEPVTTTTTNNCIVIGGGCVYCIPFQDQGRVFYH